MIISTEGWDTVFALRLPQVNAQIAHAIWAGTTKLPVLNWTSNDGSASLRDVTFTTWQLSSQGLEGTGGTQLKMRFLVNGGSFCMQDTAPAALGGSVILGTVSLAVLADVSHARLVLDHRKGVTVDTLAIIGSIPSALQPPFKLAMGLALSAALSEFGHVFASVDLNLLAAGGMPWLSPKAVGYCFFGGCDDASSYLGTLCMTDTFIAGNPTPPASLASGLVPDGATGAFVLSRELFVRNLLLPGVARGFATESLGKDSTALAAYQKQMFDLAESDSKIVKKPGSPDIFVQAVAMDLSILYSMLTLLTAGGALGALTGALSGLATALIELIATGKPNLSGSASVNIETLVIAEEAGAIVFRTGLRCDVHTASPLPKVSIATVRFDAVTSFKLAMQADGTVRFQQIGTSTHTTPTMEAPDWIKSGDTGAKILLAIVGVVLTVISEGLFAVLSGILLVGLEAAMQFLPVLIQRQIADGTGGAAPAGLERLVIAAAEPVRWTDRTFKPTSVVLNGDLAFGGTFS